MKKKLALKILINHSFILAQDIKNKLLTKVDLMSDEDVYNLGRFLALEKKKSIESNKSMIESLERMIKQIEDRIK